MIFAYHALFITGNLSSTDYGWFLNVGVPLFYSISGLLLFRPFADAILAGEPSPVLSGYSRHRLYRIVPAYWVALPLVAVLLDRTSEVFSTTGVVTYFGFLQVYSLSTIDGGIGQAWTLCVEVTFYAFLPLFAWLAARMACRSGSNPASRTRTLLALVFAVIAASVVWKIAVITHYGGDRVGAGVPLLILPAALDQFGVGMLLAVLLAARDRAGIDSKLLLASTRRPSAGVALALAAYFSLGWFAGIPPLGSHGSQPFGWGGREIGVHELKALFSFGLLIAAVTALPGRGVVGSVLGSKPLSQIGEVSYGVYLWHLAILIALVGSVSWLGGESGLMSGGVSAWIVVGLAFVATVTVAVISWRLIERPLIGRSHRRR
jgi:peptidoglycan/LPS O-acetylase OafA/YrhL